MVIDDSGPQAADANFRKVIDDSGPQAADANFRKVIDDPSPQAAMPISARLLMFPSL